MALGGRPMLIVRTELVATSMRDTVLLPALATQTLSLVTARAVGVVPTVTLAVTVFVCVSMRCTDLLPALATHTDLPSGLTATALGEVSTGMVAITWLVSVFTTFTVRAF